MLNVAGYDVPVFGEGGLNCTVIVQCPPVASIGGPFKQVLSEPLKGTMLYSAAPVPVIVGEELKLNVVGPSFVTVTESCFVLGFSTVPKPRPPVIFTAVPVPVSGSCKDVTPFGSPVKFAVTVPGVAPVAVGLKATLNTHDWFWVSIVFPDKLQSVPESPVVFNV